MIRLFSVLVTFWLQWLLHSICPTLLAAAPQIFGSTGTGGIPAIVPNGKVLEIYFTIVPTNVNTPGNGNPYVAGGDTLDLTQVLTNLQGFMISSSAVPLQVYIQSQTLAAAGTGHSGYVYGYRIGTTLKNGKMQVLQCAGATNPLAEIGAGNYPAGVLGDTIVGLAVLPIE